MGNVIPLCPHPAPRLLSVIIPVYNEQEVLPLLRERLESIQKKLSCPVEWVFVNDGSRDNSAHFIRGWGAENPSVKLIDFSRNFGHQAALTAGLDFVSGDAVVTMDADLQDPPELLFEMLEKYREGYDVVYAKRRKRHGETRFKSITAHLFYWIMKNFVHKDMPENTGDFRLLSRAAVGALKSLREGQRFIRGLIPWVGFIHTSIVFDRPGRAAGETKYPFRKMFALSLDAILSFSGKPLRVSLYLGIPILLFGVGMAVYAIIRWIFLNDLIPGWPTLVVVNCVIGGGILIVLGVMGEYLSRIYEEMKSRPLYIVRDIVNLTANHSPQRAVAPTLRISDDSDIVRAKAS